MPKHERYACSGYARLFINFSMSWQTLGPIFSAQSTMRCGVQAKYSRWVVGMCSGLVECRPFTNERIWLAMRLLEAKTSIVFKVTRSSTLCLTHLYGTLYQ